MFTAIKNALLAAWKAVRRSMRTLRHEYVIEQYLRTGAQFGDALNRLYMGECVDIADVKKRFAQLERRYASLGYRTITLDEFVEYGAYGRSLHHLLRVPRDLGEAAVYHADRLEAEYLEQGFASMRDFGDKRANWLRCGLEKDKSTGCEGRDDCRHPDEEESPGHDEE